MFNKSETIILPKGSFKKTEPDFIICLKEKKFNSLIITNLPELPRLEVYQNILKQIQSITDKKNKRAVDLAIRILEAKYQICINRDLDYHATIIAKEIIEHGGDEGKILLSKILVKRYLIVEEELRIWREKNSTDTVELKIKYLELDLKNLREEIFENGILVTAENFNFNFDNQ